MARLQELITMLNHAAADPSELACVIEQFQTTVWNSSDQELGGSDSARQVLRDLAHDLDYYVADPQARSEDPSYYGQERALQEIVGALKTIAGAGAA